jgi:hypothetical protein
VRYQESPWFIRVYRWLRWRPLYAVKTWLAVRRWKKAGSNLAPTAFVFFKTPEQYKEFIGILYRGAAEMKMQYYYTHEEVRKELGL